MGDSAEEKLIQRCLAWEPLGNASGAASPWEEFAGRYGPPLRRVLEIALARMTGRSDPALIEDILQATFLRLWENRCARLRAFQGECSLLHYLCVIALRQAQNALRRDALARPKAEPAIRDILDIEAPGVSAEASLETREGEARLHRALGELPGRQQLALRMIYWESLPPEAAADTLGLNRNAFSALLFRARESLRTLLKHRLHCL